MSNGDVLQLEIELAGTLKEVSTNTRRNLYCVTRRNAPTGQTATHHFTLCNKLCRIELSNNAFENLISNRRKHPLIIVHAEALVNPGQVFNVGS
jgi:hypothetical protein